MKRIILLILILILTLLFINCDNYTHNSISNTDPANYINLDLVKAFGGYDDDWGEDLAITSDLSCYLAGRTASFGYGASHSYLVKVNSDNELVWEKYYGGKGEDATKAISLVDDSLLYLLGYTTSFDITTGKKVDPADHPEFKFDDFNFYLIKTNLEGISYWEKPYGLLGTDEFATDIKILSDGIVLAGYSQSDIDINLFLVKTDYDGDTIWTSTFSSTNLTRAFSLAVTSDNNFIAAGDAKTAFGQKTDCYIAKVSASGQPIWEATFGESELEEGIQAILPVNDGVICSGYLISPGDENLNDGVLLILKVDLSGNLVWKYSYLTVKGNQSNCLEQSSSGNFLVVTNNTATNETTFTKFDSDGQLLWTQKKGHGAAKGLRHFPNDPIDRYIMTGQSDFPEFTSNVNVSYIIVSEDLTNVELK